MKTIVVFGLLLSFVKAWGGNLDSLSSQAQILELRMALLDSKIALYQSHLAQLDMDKGELAWSQIPGEVISHAQAIEQLEKRLNEVNNMLNVLVKPTVTQKKRLRNEIDTIRSIPTHTVMSMAPFELSKGSLLLMYERKLTPSLSLEIAGKTTYANESGLAYNYLNHQKLEYFDSEINSYVGYQGKNIMGYGVHLQVKNYLLYRIRSRSQAPIGLYVAPVIEFDRFWITGISNRYIDEEWHDFEITQLLNRYKSGIYLGNKFSLLKVLSVDVYIGGILQLSKYDKESKFTRYKRAGNIDYSGVKPVAGINIGMLK